MVDRTSRPWLPALLTAVTLMAAAVSSPASAAPVTPSPETAEAMSDQAAARAVFEANLQAIADRDREAYLATYWNAPLLTRSGYDGLSLGFEDFAAQAGDGWPEVFDAQNLALARVAPGVVFGSYRYRVAYRGEPAADGTPAPLNEVTGRSERLFLDTPEGWRIAMTSAYPAPPGTPPPPRALVGATLVDGTGGEPVADSVVVMRDGRVECAGSREDCPLPDDVATVDLSGRFLTPGLIDTHVHFSQTGWADGRPDALDVRASHPYAETIADLEAHPERFFRSLLCSGVTAVMDVGGYPWTWDLRSRAETDSRAPRVAATGPLLATVDHWLNLPAERQFIHLTDTEAARDGVAYLASQGTDAVKLWLIVGRGASVGELTAVVEAAAAAADEAELPFVVHATGLGEAKAAVSVGADVLVHSVDEAPVDDTFLEMAAEAGVIYVPTLTVTQGYLDLYRAAAAGEVPEIDDPNGCVGPATRARLAATADLDEAMLADLTETRLESTAGRIARDQETAAANLARVVAAGIPVALGTDAGNPLTLHGPSVHAELEAMQAAGMTPMQVLIAATANGARALGRDDLGTVEPGKHADLLVLAEDPTRNATALRSLTHVVRGGELRPVEELASP